MPDFEGQALIVTSSSGIGAAAARLAAAGGARLLIATSDEQAGGELAAETGAECWIGDLTRTASADSVVAHCVAKFGRLDGLFNAAGLSGRRFGDGPVDECTDEGWDVTLAQNLKVTFLMCRAALARMLRQTVALSRSMAAYYVSHKIRVNVIAPGLARTPSSERSQSDIELYQFLTKKQPLVEGMIDADLVARAAVFLLSPEARAITGEVLSVDAGWSLSGV